MPIGVLKKIVLRLCSQDSPVCDQKSFDNFVVVASIDNSAFRNRRRDIKQTCDDVANALHSYLENERGKHVDTDKCTVEILRFLDQCGHRILKEHEPIKSLPVDEKIGRYIASFIQHEQRKHSLIYDKILDLARGYMVYRCVYYHTQNEKVISTASLADVVVYLDTPLIINLLNLDTDEGNRAVVDVISLAQSLGAKVKVLEHCVEEVQGILRAYIAKYPSVQLFRLRNLTLKGYSALALNSLLTNIPNDLESILGYKADAAPGLGSSSDWDHINTEEALSRYYEDSVRERNAKVKLSHDSADALEDIIGDKRIANDVQTLSYALRLRNGSRPQQLDKCKVIVLSDSKMARKAVFYLYDDFDKQNEINLVYSMIDFSCMTWFAAPVKTVDMAEDMLLFNAAAALDASDQVIDLMLKYVDELSEVGDIGDEMAYLLRTHPAVREAVADITGNNPEGFERNMIQPIYEKVVEHRAKEVAADQYQPEIMELKNELGKEKEKETERLQKLSNSALNKSEKVAKWAKGATIVLWRCVEFAAIFYVLFVVFTNAKQGIVTWSISQVVFCVFSLLCCLDFCVPKLRFMDKQINRFASWCGDKAYNREMKRGKKYLDI